MKEARFKQLHQELGLSHHPFQRSLKYLNWLFKDINFKNKRVLDIGGGNGIYSFYAKFQGANYCLNLEPFGAGSKNVQIVRDIVLDGMEIDVQPVTFQEFEQSTLYDIIILHDSINHLDEENYELIHKDDNAYQAYSDLVSKMSKIISKNGKVIVSDCSRINFFAAMGIKNPVAPAIDWDLHQHPTILVKLFQENGFELIKLRWSPLKRLDSFGYMLTRLGFPISYFMQSHFNLVLEHK